MRFELNLQSDHDQPLIQNFCLQAQLDDGDHEFYDGLSNLPLENGQLGTITGIRYTTGFFDPREENDKLTFDLDDRDGDLSNVAQHMQICQSQIHKLFGSDIDNDIMPIGLIIVNRVEVNPFARGQKLGLTMLQALQRLHIRTPYMVALDAVPIEIDDRDPKFKPLQGRLLRYYTSCSHLGLRRVAPQKAPEFVMGYWSGDNVLPTPDLDLTFLHGVTEYAPAGLSE